MELTVKEVKEMLPDVKVRLSTGKVVKASVRGRMNKFASVFTSEGSYKFSWLAVTRAINGNHALKL